MNFDTPPENNSPLEGSEPSWDTVKDVVYTLFFENKYPTSLDDLKNKLQEQAKAKNISPEALEKQYMLYLGDQMANSVD